jgi:glucose dehydrogenase
MSTQPTYLNITVAAKWHSGFIKGKFFSAKEQFWLSQCPSREEYVTWSNEYTKTTNQRVHEHGKKYGYTTYRPLTMVEEEEVSKNEFLWNYYFGDDDDDDSCHSD